MLRVQSLLFLGPQLLEHGVLYPGDGKRINLPFGIGHGLGTDDNPIFFGMHEASALICGGSLAAAREASSSAMVR